jgi:sugar lactone lactonase YvrE
MYMEGCVKVYSPEGKELKKITFPAKGVTCTGWGGKNNDMLYVVSGKPISGESNEPSDLEGDDGGHIFSFEAGVKGMLNAEFNASAIPELGGELPEELGS